MGRGQYLRYCASFEASPPAPTYGPQSANVKWASPNCTSRMCMEQFTRLLLDCRACNNIGIQALLGDITTSLLYCRNQTCSSAIGVIKQACCAGNLCGSDGFPTVCFNGGRGDARLSPTSSCPDAVLTTALKTECTGRFTDESPLGRRLEGLYMDCGGDIDKLRRGPPSPSPPGPSATPANEHSFHDQIQVRTEWLWLGLFLLIALMVALLLLLCSRKRTLQEARRWKINTVHQHRPAHNFGYLT